MNFENEASLALTEMIEEFGSFWVWNKKTLHGMQSDKTDSNAVELTGLLPDIGFTVCFHKKDFTHNEFPETGDQIESVAEKKTYRIVSIETSEGDPSLTVSCGSLDGK